MHQATPPELAEIQVKLSDVSNYKVLCGIVHRFQVKFVVKLCDFL